MDTRYGAKFWWCAFITPNTRSSLEIRYRVDSRGTFPTKPEANHDEVSRTRPGDVPQAGVLNLHFRSDSSSSQTMGARERNTHTQYKLHSKQQVSTQHEPRPR